MALFYWLFLLLVYAVKLRSLVSQQLYITNLPYFVTYTVGFGLSLAEFLFEWLWPKTAHAYEVLVEDGGEECPEEYATVFSRLTFSWMTPMMKFGYKNFLTEEDLWGLAPNDKTSTTGEQFDTAWKYELKHREHPSIWLALFKAYGGPYLLATVFKACNDLAAFAQPQLLRLLIAFVASYHYGRTPEPLIKGVAIAFAMFGVAVLQTSMIVSYQQTKQSKLVTKYYYSTSTSSVHLSPVCASRPAYLQLSTRKRSNYLVRVEPQKLRVTSSTTWLLMHNVSRT